MNCSISVIVTSYTVDRVQDIRDLLHSLKLQVSQNFELIYVTEGSEDLHKIVSDEMTRLGLPGETLRNQGRAGLPEARNLGANAARGEILAFVDDDVTVDQNWTRTINETFLGNPRAVGLTGPAVPVWVDQPAEWLPVELDWLIGCTRWFRSDKLVEVGNCWGMNMAFRREAFISVGGFSVASTENSRYLRHSALALENQIRLEHGSMAEDVDISIRLRQLGFGAIFYVPSMLVSNKVYSYRLSSRYVVDRSRWIGFSRRNASRAIGNKRTVAPYERNLLPRMLERLVNVSDCPIVSLETLRKRYRMLFLSSFSLLLGYLLGPAS